MDTPIYAAMCEWIDVRRRAFAAPVWPVDDPDDGSDRAELTVSLCPLPDCCREWPDVGPPNPHRCLFPPTPLPTAGCWGHAA